MQPQPVSSRRTHDAAVNFRINQRLIADATDRARAQGVSLSRFLRDAVRKEIEHD